MTSAVSPYQRVFFAAVGLLAGWVAAWGLLAPANVDWALPWIVPPLHARFLGAMYLSGATFMVGALLARSWSTIRVIVPMISIWTGTLLLVSLVYLSAFDPSRQQTWVWFAAYLVYPIGAAWIAWRMRGEVQPGPGPRVPRALRIVLIVLGIAFTVLALALLFVPQLAMAYWPWAITPLLTQLYGAPFLSYGLGGLYASRQSAHTDVRLYLIGTAVFTFAVLAASVIHLQLFSAERASTWVWFFGFGLVTLVLTVGSLRRPA